MHNECESAISLHQKLLASMNSFLKRYMIPRVKSSRQH